ncbi:hypothetical protein PENTCL1PPCAC_29453, partial [Pristionchus entomophagus]
LQMRLLYPALFLLLLAMMVCRTDGAPRVMIRSGGRLDRLQENTMDSWMESLNRPSHSHHHHSHHHRRHRHKRRHHHKKKREEKDVDSILLDLDKIMRPRFG